MFSQDRGHRTSRDTVAACEGLYMCFTVVHCGPENFSVQLPSLKSFFRNSCFRFPGTGDQPRVKHMIDMPCVVCGACFSRSHREGGNKSIGWVENHDAEVPSFLLNGAAVGSTFSVTQVSVTVKKGNVDSKGSGTTINRDKWLVPRAFSHTL